METIIGDLRMQRLQVKKRCNGTCDKGGRSGFINTETVEYQYWERGGIVPKVTDHTVINLGPGSD
jgi:hypothetical protein